MGNVAWWKLKIAAEAPLYHRGSRVAETGKDAGKTLELAIYLRDGCLYCASHVEEPPLTAVNARRLRKGVLSEVYARLSHVPQGDYRAAAAAIDDLNIEHGHCWMSVYKGADGGTSVEFLEKIHEQVSKRLTEDPDICRPAVVHPDVSHP